MPDPHRDPHTDFDRWLDTGVSGTPESDDMSTGIEQTVSFAGLDDAARQFHGLAARADRNLRDGETTDRLDHLWEQIMDTTTSTPTIGSSHREISAHTDRASTPPWIAMITSSRWSTALNGALAAALVIALVAGLWRYNGAPGWIGRGGGTDPEPLRFAAMNAQGVEQTYEAEPVPTADECTVAPLTVDEVMTTLEGDPNYHLEEAWRNQEFVATPAVSATPIFDERIPRYPPLTGYVPLERDVIDNVAASHRIWLACSMTGDPFRAWAMESDARIQQTIGDRYLGGYSTEAIRADLEEVAANGAEGTRFELPSYVDDTLIPMVLIEGGDALYPTEFNTVAHVSFYWTTIDGSIAGRPNYLTEAQLGDPAYAPLRDTYPQYHNTATFIRDMSHGAWLLEATSRGQG